MKTLQNLPLILCLLAVLLHSVAAPTTAQDAAQAPSTPETTPPETTATETTPPATPKPAPAAKPAEDERLPNAPADACQGGHIVEDGKADKGYSFVSTAKWGMYVQQVTSANFPTRHLKDVCVCWFQKPGGGDADFEVVFFTDQGGRPSMEPYAKVKGKATAIGEGKLDAKWHAVDVSGVSIPEGPSYIGVRWQPRKEPRLFVCSDHSPETPRQPGFFGEDRSRGWSNVATTADPIFIPHRALLIRSVSHPEGWEPPPAKAEPAASATPQVEPATAEPADAQPDA